MREPLKFIRLWYLLGGILLILVAITSLIPVPDIGVGDKTAHVVTYAVLSGWFSLLAIDCAALGYSALGLMGYGVMIEVLQGLTGYRHAEWADLLANTLGIGVGLLAYPLALRRLLVLVDTWLARLFQR